MTREFEKQLDRGCRSKRAYAARDAATAVLQKSVRSGNARVNEMVVYQCRHCQYFHIGHAVPKYIREQSA